MLFFLKPLVEHFISIDMVHKHFLEKKCYNYSSLLCTYSSYSREYPFLTTVLLQSIFIYIKHFSFPNAYVSVAFWWYLQLVMFQAVSSDKFKSFYFPLFSAHFQIFQDFQSKRHTDEHRHFHSFFHIIRFITTSSLRLCVVYHIALHCTAQHPSSLA